MKRRLKYLAENWPIPLFWILIVIASVAVVMIFVLGYLAIAVSSDDLSYDLSGAAALTALLTLFAGGGAAFVRYWNQDHF